jgi:Zn finger protein HypA/HybF involved in hydrogenase expression
MNPCKHHNLVLIPEKKNVLRCRHCHLTINADELHGGCCPECFDVHGQRHYDFDSIESPDKGKIRYRCEQCGLIIEID